MCDNRKKKKPYGGMTAEMRTKLRLRYQALHKNTKTCKCGHPMEHVCAPIQSDKDKEIARAKEEIARLKLKIKQLQKEVA